MGRLNALVGAHPRTVAVLYARADSNYKMLPGTDVWDAARDARLWPGGAPVVAHPPCRAWGRFKHFAKPRPDEKALALHAVAMVREWGGVLEHPKDSALWPELGLPAPGQRDEYGGWTLPVFQSWWGHLAEKATKLYVCGCNPLDVPPMPMMLGEAPKVIAQMRTMKDGSRLKKGMPGWRPEVSKAQREHTPPEFAAWLCELARRCVCSNAEAHPTARPEPNHE